MYEKQLFSPEGNWIGTTVAIRTPDGKITRTWRPKDIRSGKRTKEAEFKAWLKQLESDICDGTVKTKKKAKAEEAARAEEERKSPTIRQYAESTYLPYVEQNKRRNTYVAYKRAFDNYLLPEIGDLKVIDTRKQDISKCITAIQSKDLSYATVKLIKASIHSMFDYAVENEIVEVNPVSKVKIERNKDAIQKDTVEYFTEEELKIAAAHSRDFSRELAAAPFI